MDDKVKRVGSSLIPLSKPLAGNDTPDVVPDVPLVQVVKLPPVKSVDPWLHPNLFVGLRNTFVPFETLEKFIFWQRTKLTKAQMLNFRNAAQINTEVKETIEDLIPIFFKNNADLMSVLKNRLIKSTDFEEKIILLKVFFSTENEEQIFDSFLLPSLEKKEGFENLEANHEFCVYFLSSIDKDSLNKILTRLDYSKLRDLDTFSKSILKISHPEEVFDFLIGVNEKLILDNDETLENYQKIKKVQELILSCMNSLGEVPGYVALDDLKVLYKTAVDHDIEKQAAVLLTLYFRNEAITIFKDAILEKDNDCDECRRKRFFAIGYYVNVNQEYSVPFLKEVLAKEDDPFIAGSMCYYLAKYCGVDGKRALADIVVKQIRESQGSIPLSCIIQLANYGGDEYKKLLKNILMRYYKTDEGLKKAFLNLEETKLCPILRSEEGIMVFHLTQSDDFKLVTDFINQIGLQHLIEWAGNNKEDLSREEQSLKDNSGEVLEYAWGKYKNKMTDLILETMPLGDSELKTKSKSLVGKSFSGDEQMLELRPFR